ncbi:UNVERIFIED_CONTAM: ABC transporter B family member 2 [Sesamum angustifolium]|uniref:ABC transporter B family member 2 n=1 Tax=Sesamum angustifolium TaxID=2727405 RepID=A0AAW2MMN5_9LAMI
MNLQESASSGGGTAPFSISRNDEEEKQKKSGKAATTKSVGLRKLFAFADGYDYFLMFVGSVGACVHGASVPVFFIFFGQLINIIGLAYLFPKEASHKVAKGGDKTVAIETMRNGRILREYG